jgi:hypothetical protein
MDGDKRRMFLERMRASPFNNVAMDATSGGGGGGRSRSNESSYRVRPSDSFYVKDNAGVGMRFDGGGGGGSGFRSLSTESSNRRNVMMTSSPQPQSAVVGLFCDEEDESPLQVGHTNSLILFLYIF